MLKSLLPKAHARMLALPLLGPIADGFDALARGQRAARAGSG